MSTTGPPPPSRPSPPVVEEKEEGPRKMEPDVDLLLQQVGWYIVVELGDRITKKNMKI